MHKCRLPVLVYIHCAVTSRTSQRNTNQYRRTGMDGDGDRLTDCHKRREKKTKTSRYTLFFQISSHGQALPRGQGSRGPERPLL